MKINHAHIQQNMHAHAQLINPNTVWDFAKKIENIFRFSLSDTEISFATLRAQWGDLLFGLKRDAECGKMRSRSSHEPPNATT